MIEQIEKNLQEAMNSLEILKKQERDAAINEICDRLNRIETELRQLRKAIM